jgi:uncharacterized protein YndB with AHSA1/START domain
VRSVGNGELVTTKTRTIVQRYFLRASPARVFRALATPQGLAGWFLEAAELPRTPGAPYKFRWQGGYEHSGRVVKIDPGRSMTLTWPQGTRENPLEETRVTFTLRAKRGGTLLELRHTGYGLGEPWVETYARTYSGWAYYMTNLKSVLANGADLRAPDDEF